MIPLTCIIVDKEGKVLRPPLGEPVAAVALGLVVHARGQPLGPGVREGRVEVLQELLGELEPRAVDPPVVEHLCVGMSRVKSHDSSLLTRS